MARSHTKIKSKDNILDYILLVIFIGVIIVTLYPFLNVLAISFNDPIDTMRNINFIIPRKFTWSNYTYVFQENNLFEPFAMSIVRTLIGTLTGVAATAMVAYVLSRRDFYFNKLFTVLFVITMYVSGGLVPEYLLITKIVKIRKSFSGLYTSGTDLGVQYHSDPFVYRRTADCPCRRQPRIDGANDFIIFAKIVLPLCKPVLATVALFVAVGQWNSFMDTYLYARDLPTLQYVLYEIMEKATIKVDPHAAEQLKSAVSPMSIRMAITIIATVPIWLCIRSCSGIL